LLLSLVACATIFAAAGCAGTATSPPAYASFSESDVVVGTGASAANGQTVSVNYAGWLYDPSQPDQRGAQFDASVPGTPFTFVLGSGQVIKGWDQGVAGMKVGGKRRLIVPPSLAYGDTRRGVIPPNATLLFDIELLDVK
jgi:FKBP-type peptidyl-prolyl cis-trans isomerase FkpA